MRGEKKPKYFALLKSENGLAGFPHFVHFDPQLWQIGCTTDSAWFDKCKCSLPPEKLGAEKCWQTGSNSWHISENNLENPHQKQNNKNVMGQMSKNFCHD